MVLPLIPIFLGAAMIGSSAIMVAPYVNEEAKKDNELQVTNINRDMANDLTTLVRNDILGKPGQFQNVLYKVNSKIIDSDNPESGEKEKNITKSIGIDTGYTDLINKLLKEK